ncbi:hypothetical protein [Paenibacillus sp. NFR01]|uniref:hypothetical protein n=1 Tax=Paenibacillus sp. NFR01 TaxID=1566279 RepID=UPI000B83C5C9|nr:hypothetical protein [Paenibacillus sp. NFR01]
MINQEIKGIWSVDCMYRPGAQADERVVFLENGFGWIEILNWSSISVETFNWTVENARLNIKGELCSSNYEEPESSNLNVVRMEFFVVDELTPSGKTMKVINFSRPICLNNMKFGLLEKDVKDDYYIKRQKLLENKIGLNE